MKCNNPGRKARWDEFVKNSENGTSQSDAWHLRSTMDVGICPPIRLRNEAEGSSFQCGSELRFYIYVCNTTVSDFDLYPLQSSLLSTHTHIKAMTHGTGCLFWVSCLSSASVDYTSSTKHQECPTAVGSTEPTRTSSSTAPNCRWPSH